MLICLVWFTLVDFADQSHVGPISDVLDYVFRAMVCVVETLSRTSCISSTWPRS